MRELRREVLVLCVALLAVAYLPHAVRFLRTDDFIRILDNYALGGEYFRNLLVDPKTDGFYRPLNHLSFGLCHALFGMNPAGYAAVNGGLVLGSLLLFFFVVERVTRSTLLASWASLAWLLNVEVVLAPLWWASGRTTGLAAFFVLLSAFAITRVEKSNRVWLLPASAVAAFLALLGKESAIPWVALLPVLAYWRDRRQEAGPRNAAWVALGVSAVLAVYAWLRSAAGSMGPFSAPVWYRYDLAASNLVSNLTEYLKDSLLYAILAVPALLIAQRPWRGSAGEPVVPSRRRILLLGAGLFLISSSTMLALPHRSSLYPFFPSLFVVVAVVGSVLRRPREAGQGGRLRRRTLAAMAVLAAAITPLAWLEGREKIREHRHVHDWSALVSRELEVSGEAVVAVSYDATAADAVELAPRDLEFLAFALRARTGRPIEVLVNPDDPPAGVSRWRVAPDPSGRSRALLLPAVSGSRR